MSFYFTCDTKAIIKSYNSGIIFECRKNIAAKIFFPRADLPLPLYFAPPRVIAFQAAGAEFC